MDAMEIVWLIEDDEEQADQYGRLLEIASDNQFRVHYVAVKPHITDYVDLLADDRTKAIIIDQRLSELSGVPYEGIEVAEFLRAAQPELPIFILTQHSNDDLLLEKESSVEFVMGKDELTNRDVAYAARILRNIGRYEAALSKKQIRLKELIDLKLSDELSSSEETELQQLRSDFERPFAQQLAQQESSWESDQTSREEFLQQLQQITQSIRETVNRKDS
ncbi:MAG: hypothetical protein IAF02_12390 [Anaerolineae bacterium]|nr:hypothetical protein [Anaerolineae bacterium]